MTVESATTELVSRRSLEDDDAVIGRLPITVGPGIHPFTLMVRDLGEEPADRGNWTRGSVTALSQSNLPEISDLAVAADSGNGVSAILDFNRYVFVNSDLTINLLRRPAGEWICVEARTALGPDGGGLAESALYDVGGPIGRATQSLAVRARSS